jgi:hypothetical protein
MTITKNPQVHTLTRPSRLLHLTKYNWFRNTFGHGREVKYTLTLANSSRGHPISLSRPPSSSPRTEPGQ